MHALRPSTPSFSFRALRIVALTAFLVSPTAALAGVVTGFVSASGPGLASMSFNNLATPAADNDNIAGTSPNYITINQKAYDVVGYIDMVFAVKDSGGTTEYAMNEGVFNGTGVDWTDYHLELGFGTGTSFVPSPAGDGLDFDAPDQDSPYVLAPFTSLTINEDTIDAVGGTIVAGGFFPFSFPIDVPSGITEFTVRQWPTTEPVSSEPSTWSKIKALYN